MSILCDTDVQDKLPDIVPNEPRSTKQSVTCWFAVVQVQLRRVVSLQPAVHCLYPEEVQQSLCMHRNMKMQIRYWNMNTCPCDMCLWDCERTWTSKSSSMGVSTTWKGTSSVMKVHFLETWGACGMWYACCSALCLSLDWCYFIGETTHDWIRSGSLFNGC